MADEFRGDATAGSARRLMPVALRQRLRVLAAGLRRFAVILAGLSGITVVGSLGLALISGWSVDRALSIGFDIVGIFFLLGGFFVGNRGPVRPKGQAAALLFGERHLRWATESEREEAITDSAVFITVGLAMIVIGIAIDSRASLF
jgi:hypothetical protein